LELALIATTRAINGDVLASKVWKMHKETHITGILTKRAAQAEQHLPLLLLCLSKDG
jgi:hypothetical protein